MTRETETAVERARLLCANGHLRDLRDRAGVTLDVVAEIVGVSAPTVNRWEHGLVTPSTRSAARLAEVIDLLEEATTIPRREPGAPGSPAAVLVNRFRARPGPRPCLAALDRLVLGSPPVTPVTPVTVAPTRRCAHSTEYGRRRCSRDAVYRHPETGEPSCWQHVPRYHKAPEPELLDAPGS